VADREDRTKAKAAEEATQDRDEAPAASEPPATTPSRAPAHAPRRSGPRAIVVLLVLATAVAVYVRWHEDIARFVGQYLHPG
jgi:hypothetical protein